MEEKEIDVLEIDGKEFCIVDTIDKYSYISEIINPTNIMVLKEENDFLESLSSSIEVENALNLYYQKHSA